MAQERPSTPEKQLLKLIEDPRPRDLSQTKIKRRSVGLFSLAALRGRVSFFLESARYGAFFKKAFLDVKGFNRVLRGCIFFLILYLVGNFAMSFARLQKVPDFTTKSTRKSSDVKADGGPAAKKIAFYLEGPRSRDIFKFGDFGKEEVAEEREAEVVPPVEVVISEAEKLARQLGLVGIGWSDDPDVMVENVETKKIYFLKRGQRIDGLIKVDTIFEDKVILTYDNGKELELR